MSLLTENGLIVGLGIRLGEDVRKNRRTILIVRQKILGHLNKCFEGVEGVGVFENI